MRSSRLVPGVGLETLYIPPAFRRSLLLVMPCGILPALALGIFARIPQLAVEMKMSCIELLILFGGDRAFIDI